MKTLLSWVGGVLLVVAVFAAIGVGIYYLDKAEQAGQRRQDAKMERANTICGEGPESVIQHGAGWSTTPWIEVRCQDGTVRVIP